MVLSFSSQQNAPGVSQGTFLGVEEHSGPSFAGDKIPGKSAWFTTPSPKPILTGTLIKPGLSQGGKASPKEPCR